MMVEKQTALLALSLMDLTSLNETDNNDKIIQLVNQSNTPYGGVAAICVYSNFIEIAKQTLLTKALNQTIDIATVVNFPKGEKDLEKVLSEVEVAIKSGATEIDLVLPYRNLIAGQTEAPLAMVKACKLLCGSKSLKVIIESGELKKPELIKTASQICIDGGADFIKTSTGKVPINATLEATQVILTVIKENKKNVGIKVAGGVKTIADVSAYLNQAKTVMGEGWIKKSTFRFGASSLLSHLVDVIEGKNTVVTNNSHY